MNYEQTTLLFLNFAAIAACLYGVAMLVAGDDAKTVIKNIFDIRLATGYDFGMLGKFKFNLDLIDLAVALAALYGFAFTDSSVWPLWWVTEALLMGLPFTSKIALDRLKAI